MFHFFRRGSLPLWHELQCQLEETNTHGSRLSYSPRWGWWCWCRGGGGVRWAAGLLADPQSILFPAPVPIPALGGGRGCAVSARRLFFVLLRLGGFQPRFFLLCVTCHHPSFCSLSPRRVLKSLIWRHPARPPSLLWVYTFFVPS